jgi:hypothetical protein
MTDGHKTRTPAYDATSERFASAVASADDRYPDRTAFVAADTPGLAEVLARNLEEKRTTAIVHDDGSEILIEPPDLGRVALWLALVAGALILGKRSRPQVEAGGQVVELPVGARVLWRAREAFAA